MCKIKTVKEKNLVNNFCRHVIFAVSALQRAFIVRNFIWCRKNCPLYGVSAL